MDMLLCFEAVARHKSFTQAAEELCLTQSAVSKKIAGLESYFSTKLFHRNHRSITLTQGGQDILTSIEEGLTQLQLGLNKALPESNDPHLTISASVSFAYFWLIPRLEKFKILHPDIQVNVISSDRPVDFKKDGSEIAILFGDGQWQDLQSNKLVDEIIHVVASPAYLSKHEKITFENLTAHSLIQLKEGVQISDGIDWDKWMLHHKMSGKSQRQGPVFNSYPMVLQAVEAGQGLGLGWHYAVEDKLRSGTLISVFEEPLRTQNGYYLAVRKFDDLSLNARKFRDWILSER